MRSCAPSDVSVDTVRQRILRGDIVRMGFAGGESVWWFDDPYEPVDDAVMQMAMLGHNGGPLLDESGDSLFGWEGNSQTWYYALSG